MGFRLLGPVRLLIDGKDVDLGRRQERCVLCMLLLVPGRIVPADRLLELLWPGQPPGSGRATLHTYIARLRRRLEPLGMALRTRGGGYLLDIDPLLVDLHRFNAAVRRAQSLPSAAERLALLDEALGLWQGPLMADVADAELRDRLGVDVEERRLTALELRAETLVEMGQADAAIDVLRPHAKEHPTRERPVELLMRGLYALGRQADALALYRQTRTTLVTDLGIELGQALEELHRRILSGDATLVPPRRTLGALTTFLPRDVPDFTGRAGDLDWLDDIAAQPGRTAIISAISGAAGVGKTALAVHWASSAARRFPDGQLYLNLRGYSPGPPMTSLEALGQLLRVLGTPPEGIPDTVEAAAALYRGILADRRTLILLDNAYSADQVRPLLPGGPANLVLITSRDRLGGLIAREGARRLTLDTLTDLESFELLRRILGTHRVNDEVDAAMDLIKVCGGLPLALRIAAARLADETEHSLREFTDTLRSKDRVTPLEVEGDPEGAVRSVFALSVARLDDDTARLFRRIGLLPVPTAGAYLAPMLLDRPEGFAFACLRRLADASLVTLQANPGGTHYRVHDLIHAYAAQLANDADEAALRSCYSALVERVLHADAANPSRHFPSPEPDHTVVPASDDPMRWFDTEHDLLLQAALDAASRGWPEPAWKLVSGLANYAGCKNHVNEWIRVSEHLLDVIQDETGIAMLSLGLGGMLRSRGDVKRAMPMLRRARRGFARQEDWRRAATAATQLSMAYRVSGRARAARCAVRWAIARLEAVPTTSQLGWAHIALGNLLTELDADYPAAMAAFERAVEVMRATDDRTGLGNALAASGQAMLRQGKLGEATLARFTEAISVVAEAGDSVGMCMVEGAVARLHLMRGELARALTHSERAVAMARDSYNPHGLRVALIATGEALLASGNPELARERLHEAAHLARKLGAAAGLAAALELLSKALLAIGERHAAYDAAHEAHDLYRKLGRPEADTLAHRLGELADSTKMGVA